MELELDVSKVKLALEYFDYANLCSNLFFYTKLIQQYGAEAVSFWYGIKGKVTLVKRRINGKQGFGSVENSLSEEELNRGKEISLFKHYSKQSDVYIEDPFVGLVTSSFPESPRFSLKVYRDIDASFLVYVNNFPLTNKTKTKESILLVEADLSRADMEEMSKSEDPLFKLRFDVEEA